MKMVFEITFEGPDEDTIMGKVLYWNNKGWHIGSLIRKEDHEIIPVEQRTHKHIQKRIRLTKDIQDDDEED